MSLIKLEEITRVYEDGGTAFKALRNVSLEIEKGETVAVIGKSGSGKSTIMHLLALLDKPTSGSIYINDKNTKTFSDDEINETRNQYFGFVFQQFFLNGDDTVLNNVVLPLKIAGVSAKERKIRALEVLKAVGLEDKAENKANNLSGGQKQRACIARALINNPSVIFADEPTGNLDSHNGEMIIDLLFKLNKKDKITLIVVTHDPDISKLCGREIHIKDGQVIGDLKK